MWFVGFKLELDNVQFELCKGPLVRFANYTQNECSLKSLKPFKFKYSVKSGSLTELLATGCVVTIRPAPETTLVSSVVHSGWHSLVVDNLTFTPSLESLMFDVEKDTRNELRLTFRSTLVSSEEQVFKADVYLNSEALGERV